MRIPETVRNGQPCKRRSRMSEMHMTILTFVRQMSSLFCF